VEGEKMAGEAIVVRGARPSSIRLQESYRYEQSFSRNPSLMPAGSPSGEIEVVVPYDGYAYFTPWVRAQIEGEINRLSLTGNINAEVGRLTMSNRGHTDLPNTMSLEVPVFGGGIGSLDDLCGDRHVCRLSEGYQPNVPEDNPIAVHLELLDEDILELSAGDYFAGRRGRRLDDAVAQITEQVTFKRYLVLFMGVKLSIRSDSVPPPVFAKIARVSLKWPTLTHFRGFHLIVGEPGYGSEGVVSYNPLSRSLEWFDIPIQKDPKVDGGLNTYFSSAMFLLIDQPGELYGQANLKGTIEVEIRGLLSGVRASIDGEAGVQIDSAVARERGPAATSINPAVAVGAAGPAPGGPQAGNGASMANAGPAGAEEPSPTKSEFVTRLTTSIDLALDDAFQGRTRAPFQQIHFDEVIPDPMRVADIKTSLFDRGFKIEDFPLASDHDHLRHLLVAERSEGHLKLWIVVDGRKFTTQRRTEVPGGQVYTSTFERGEMRVYMRGEMAGEGYGLIEEMNMVQLALRDRFGRLRARR
jgi:hypothetical protein